MHESIIENTKKEFNEDLKAFENWVLDEFFAKEIMPALRMFTTQMNAVAIQQMQILGGFFDAKNQMETQRLFQKLQAEAHRDYIPSDQFCLFGTNIKAMAGATSKAKVTALSLSQKAMDRHLGNINSKAYSAEVDLSTRWHYFRTRYCDPSDNNRSPLFAVESGSGLELACDHDGAGGENDMGADITFRVNRDVDYARLIDLQPTIDVDFMDGKANSDDEEDVVALSENLYGHRVLTREISAPMIAKEPVQNLYFALRSVAAKRSVAEYAFQAVVGLKSSGTAKQYEEYMGGVAPLAIGHARQYLGAILRNLYPHSGFTPSPPEGPELSDGDIYTMMGADPSYFSQLEIMGKKMYQDPDFYVKLYDTPANVARKQVAMKAIELMIDREMYESQLRREMVVSVLLSSKLKAVERRVGEELTKGLASAQ